MSKTTSPTGLTCPVCNLLVEQLDGVAICDRCGWAPRQGAD
jgi:hypothetical protein